MLGPDDRLLFHEQGFLGPLPLAAAGPSTALAARIAPIVEAGSSWTGHGTYARHLDSRQVFDLCTDPAVLAAARLILGNDLLLWNSSFWIKRADSPPTPWHQDVHYWPTALTLTAWIALTDTDEMTGCLVVVPGSQMSLLPLVSAPPGSLFEYEADSSKLPADAAHPIPARAGGFVLLGDRTLHRSAPHTAMSAPADRWGLAVRFTVPFIRVPPDRLPVFPGHHSILVSGTDRFEVNRLGPAPRATM